MTTKWEMSGPEEGDEIDMTVLLTYEGEEIIEITEGTTAERKKTARRLADLLNKAGGEPLS